MSQPPDSSADLPVSARGDGRIRACEGILWSRLGQRPLQAGTRALRQLQALPPAALRSETGLSEAQDEIAKPPSARRSTRRLRALWSGTARRFKLRHTAWPVLAAAVALAGLTLYLVFRGASPLGAVPPLASLGKIVFVAEPEQGAEQSALLVRGTGAQTQRLALKKDQALYAGDRIETPPLAPLLKYGTAQAAAIRTVRAALDLAGGATVDLAGGTIFECLDAATARLERGQMYADVSAGEAGRQKAEGRSEDSEGEDLKAKSPKPEAEVSALLFRTPCADVETQRASFELTCDAQKTALKVERGRVDFANAQGRRRLEALQESSATTLSAPAEPAAVTAAALWRGRLMAKPAAGQAQGAVYYVDQNHPAASDSNAGVSEAAPWKTLAKAFATVRPGDTVSVKGSAEPGSPSAVYRRAGTDGFAIVTPGSAGRPIAFRAYAGHTVVIEGDGSGFGIALDQASYHVFSGFIVRKFMKAAEGEASKRDILIERCEFTRTSRTGLRFRNITNLTLRDCRIHRCAEAGISVRDSRAVLLERVESSFNLGSAEGRDGDGFHVLFGENVRFLHCAARGNEASGFNLTANGALEGCIAANNKAVNFNFSRKAEDGYAPKAVYLVNCVAHGAGEAGIKVNGGAELHLHHSVVYGNAEEGVAFRETKNSRPASQISNTIIAGNGTLGVELRPGNGLAAGHNLYDRNGEAHASGFAPEASSILDRDPEFSSPAESDFHLRPTSPALHAGAAGPDAEALKLRYGLEWNRDLEGVKRPLDRVPHLGVYETVKPGPKPAERDDRF